MTSENEFEEGIKYYKLRKGEDLPSEFCAVRDKNGEPSEYTFYVPESEVAKLRELARDMLETLYWGDYYLKQTGRTFQPSRYEARMRELGVEVDG